MDSLTHRPRHAAGAADTGTVEMVAAVSDKKIRVLALTLIATQTTTTNVKVLNGDNDILGTTGSLIPMSIDVSADTHGQFTLPYNPGGWFTTDTVNESLDITLSAAQDVVYALTYILVD